MVTNSLFKIKGVDVVVTDIVRELDAHWLDEDTLQNQLLIQRL